MHSEIGDGNWPGHGDEETMYAKAQRKKGWLKSNDANMMDQEPWPHHVINSSGTESMDERFPPRKIIDHQNTLGSELKVPSE